MILDVDLFFFSYLLLNLIIDEMNENWVENFVVILSKKTFFF